MSRSADSEAILDGLRPFLFEAELNREIPPERIYRAAGIGALTIAAERLAENDAEAAALLTETVRFAPAESFQVRAFQILESAAANGIQAAIAAVYALALDFQSEQALTTIRERKIPAPDPAREAAANLITNERKRLLKRDPNLSELTRAFLAGNDALRSLLLSRAEKLLSGWRALMLWLSAPDDPDRRRDLVAAFATFSSEERRCFFSLMNDHPESARPVLADAWLRNDDAELRRLCETLAAKPSNPDDAAVYYYLIEDWARYRETDLDYRAILRVFDQPDRALQLRLIALAGRTGSGEWLSALNPDDRLSAPKTAFEFADWLTQFRMAAERQDGQRLWRLAQLAPLTLVPEALNDLDSMGFRPQTGIDQAEETALFERLRAFLNENPPPYPPTLHSAAHHIAGTPRDFQLNADGRLIVLTGESGKIVVLCADALTTPIINIKLPGFSPRLAKISHDGKQLISVWADRSVRVFDLRTGGLVHQFSLPGAGTVNFWLSADGRRIIRLDSDGTVHEISFPTGVELSCENFSGGLTAVRGAYDAEKHRLLIVSADGTAVYVDLKRRLPLNRFEIAMPIRFISDSIERDWLIHATDSELTVTHCPSGNRVLTKSSAGLDAARLTAAALIPDCGCVLAFRADGSVMAYAVPGGENLGEFSLPLENCGLARVSRDGQYLYVVTEDGRLNQFSLHDFRLSLLPVDRIEPTDLDAPRLSNRLRELLRERIDWERRFEIDLDFDDEFE